jgi:hypothetical protein
MDPNSILADFVFLLHLLFVLWFVWAPFSSNDAMLTLHFIVFPFLALHWILLSDDCSLTLLECKLRGLDRPEKSFFWHVVSPIYKPRTDETGRTLIWIISIALWSVTVTKIINDPSIVKNVFGNVFDSWREGLKAKDRFGGGPTKP